MANTPSENVLILMYHQVCAPPRGARIRSLYVTPRQFTAQIRWLRDLPLDFRSFATLKRPCHPEARCRAIITFDDGALNVHQNAFPVLREAGIPAVVYPVVGDLGKRGVVWEQSSEKTPVDIIGDEQVREMAQAGIEFGSHLLTHRRLTRMPPEERSAELTRSRERLEAITGTPVLSVAYPYGAVDEPTARLAHAAGYRYGVTTENGINTAASDPMRLRRLAVRGCKWYHPVAFRRSIRQVLAGTR